MPFGCITLQHKDRPKYLSTLLQKNESKEKLGTKVADTNEILLLIICYQGVSICNATDCLKYASIQYIKYYHYALT